MSGDQNGWRLWGLPTLPGFLEILLPGLFLEIPRWWHAWVPGLKMANYSPQRPFYFHHPFIKFPFPAHQEIELQDHRIHSPFPAYLEIRKFNFWRALSLSLFLLRFRGQECPQSSILVRVTKQKQKFVCTPPLSLLFSLFIRDSCQRYGG